jgi:hypothetical protein
VSTSCISDLDHQILTASHRLVCRPLAPGPGVDVAGQVFTEKWFAILDALDHPVQVALLALAESPSAPLASLLQQHNNFILILDLFF